MSKEKILVSGLSLFLILCGGCAHATSSGKGEGSTTAIAKIDYKKWKNCYEINNGLARVVVAPSFGGRILYYGVDGKNMIADIFTMPDGKKRSWGHQIDVVTEDKTSKLEPWWSDEYSAKIIGPYSLRMSSKVHQDYGVRLIKEITLLKNSTKLRTRNILVNEKGVRRKWQLWNRSLFIGEGYAFFPLNPKSVFPKGWGVSKGTLESPEHPYCKVLNNWLIVWAKTPKPGKVWADSDAGWIAYVKDDILCLRTYPYYPMEEYKSLHERERVSVAVYFTDNRAEIEPQSPWFSLKKGQRYEFNEEWQLTKLKRRIADFEEVLTLSPLILKGTFEVKDEYEKKW